MNKRTLSIFSFSVFVAGVLAGMVLFGLSTWASVEAVFYGFDTMSGKNQSSLNCPLFVTPSDDAVVTMKIKNPNDRKVQATIRADISNVGQFRTYTERITVEPHQTRVMSWQVTPEDVVLGRFIFLKAYQYGAYPLPTAEMTCGMFFVNAGGLGGMQLFWSLLAANLVLMAAGLLLWRRANPDPIGWLLNLERAMKTMAGIVIAGIVTALSGWWIGGLLLLAICILMICVLVFFLANRPQMPSN